MYCCIRSHPRSPAASSHSWPLYSVQLLQHNLQSNTDRDCGKDAVPSLTMETWATVKQLCIPWVLCLPTVLSRGRRSGTMSEAVLFTVTWLRAHGLTSA